MLTQARLKELLHYDPDTGEWTRLKSVKGWKSGSKVGCIAHGYHQITVDGCKYYAHRLAWLYVHGTWPEFQIDHKNLDKKCNAFSNLRTATNVQNIWNGPVKKGNTSGYKGVHWHKRSGKWCSQIRVAGRRFFVGLFSTAEAAHAAYCDAAKRHHGEFARGA